LPDKIHLLAIDFARITRLQGAVRERRGYSDFVIESGTIQMQREVAVAGALPEEDPPPPAESLPVRLSAFRLTH
jgi:hypothetical protein